jgi:uridine phosphorylase
VISVKTRPAPAGAWYLGLERGEVAPRCILVGDRARVDLFGEQLQEARVLSDKRGLRTMGGTFNGVPVTIAAFGMGAPIAAVLLEELAVIGVRVALRAGTAMSLAPDRLPLGSFIVAHAALRADGTSLTYAPLGYPAAADPLAVNAVTDVLDKSGLPHSVGILATADGFYTEMLAPSEARSESVRRRHNEFRKVGVLAADMETATLFVVASLLGVRAGSLCLVSVDGPGRALLDDDSRHAGEAQLVDAALRALIAIPDPAERRTAIA